MNTASLHVFRYNGLPANLARHGLTQTGEGVTLTEKEARYIMATGSTEFTATGRVTGEHTKFSKEEMDAAEEDSTGAKAALEDAAATTPVESSAPPETPAETTPEPETTPETVPKPAPKSNRRRR